MPVRLARAGGPILRRRARPGPVASVVAAAALAAAAALSGCGIAGGSTSLGPTTTKAASQVALTVDPVEGPIGTVFTLAAGGMTAGDAVQFEITFPGDGRAYPGNALVVADDGTASATYRATTANVPGPYVVRLTGPQGQLATGEFRVTDGKPLISTTTAKPSSSTSGVGKPPSSTKPTPTSAKGSTTSRPSPSTTKAPSSTTRPTTVAPTAPPTTPAPPSTSPPSG